MTNELGIKQGDVVFSRGNNWFERLIRFGTRSEINHVGIVYKVHEDGVIVAESMPEGFVKNFYHNNYILTDCEVRRVFKTMSPNKTEKLLLTIDSFIGTPYDWLAIKRIILKILTLGLYKGWLTTEHKMICSESVARILSIMGWRKVPKIYDMTTPKDLRWAMDIIVSPLAQKQ